MKIPYRISDFTKAGWQNGEPSGKRWAELTRHEKVVEILVAIGFFAIIGIVYWVAKLFGSDI